MSSTPWTEKARSMVGRAVLAPSRHNTQPWFFRVAESSIDLFADRTRALPVNDPEDRELVISCGAALMNLRIAGASSGWDAIVDLLRQPEDSDVLARVTLSRPSRALGEDAQLGEFLERRRTYRKLFAPEEVSASALCRLVAAAKHEGARLVPLLSEDASRQAAQLVAEGDTVQWSNPSWRRELAAWMHPRRCGDGFTVPALAAPVAQLVVRTFDMGGGIGAKDRQLAKVYGSLRWYVGNRQLHARLEIARRPVTPAVVRRDVMPASRVLGRRFGLGDRARSRRETQT